MPRLSDRAFEILSAEVQRLCGPHHLQQVRKDIVLKRLQKLRQVEGPPLTLLELRDTLDDIFPDFSEAVFKQAIKANGHARVTRNLGWVGATALGLVGLSGAVWVLNLPYPMIRWPVAKVAPLILLPSFIRMDNDYRQTVSLVAQADQLVNQATSAQDIELGGEKVTQAQKHLDGLPVWFLGYYPQTYCSFFGCAWRFTFDEFQTARADVGRMQAKVFQEKNAQTLLTTVTAQVESAKQTYQTTQVTADKVAALGAWQTGIDKLNEIPPVTLAGRMAKTKLTAYNRDLSQISGNVAGGNRSNSLIDAAKAFATQAIQKGQNPPHDVATWNGVKTLWEEAIKRLSQVPVEDMGYNEAQSLLAQYTSAKGVVETRIAAEEESTQAFESAQSMNTRFLAQDLKSMAPNQIASQMQAIANELEKVKPGTTHYEEAKEMLRSVEEKLKQLNP